MKHEDYTDFNDELTTEINNFNILPTSIYIIRAGCDLDKMISHE